VAARSPPQAAAVTPAPTFKFDSVAGDTLNAPLWMVPDFPPCSAVSLFSSLIAFITFSSLNFGHQHISMSLCFHNATDVPGGGFETRNPAIGGKLSFTHQNFRPRTEGGCPAQGVRYFISI
jgi:hypothetical protein